MTRHIYPFLLFILLLCFNAPAQEARLFKPSVSLNYTYTPESKLSDSSGTFGDQSARLGFFIPIYSHLSQRDSSSKPTYFQLMGHGTGTLSAPHLTDVIRDQNLIGASAGVTALLVRNRKNIFSVSLSAVSRNDEQTIENPIIRYSGIALYRRNVSRGFSFHLGAGYSYFVGRGILFPALGLSFITGKRSRMIINFPSRISFVQRLGSKVMLTAYLKPQGGFNFISNQSSYTNLPAEYYFRQRESHLGISGLYRITKNFNVSADIGLAARRSIALSGSLERNSAALYKTKVENGAYFGVGVKYIFHSLKKDKEKDILNLDKEKEEELLSDPDFYNIISD